ncbi:MAG: dicarboxylate/amino acid:cation symporter [Lachnobacterium sp.]|nr:dicarboxylate/amino acid:cation symporter [Lachnobacterium sp.]
MSNAVEKSTKKKPMPLAAQIFIALVLAILTGLASSAFLGENISLVDKYILPFGTIFLNLVKFIVGPIVLFSIMAGVVSMKDIKKVGAVGGTTLLYYLCTTAFATAIGLGVANIFSNLFPRLSVEGVTYKAQKGQSLMDTIVNIFPSNFLAPITEANMLQVIVMALILGFAVILAGPKASPAIKAIDVANEVFMKAMDMILKLSPIGVFCLLTPVIAKEGPRIIGSLAMVLMAAYIAYVIHVIVVYSLAVKTLGGMSPVKFFKGMMPAILFAFSSASSVGTLPLNLECTKRIGAKEEVSTFVLPLGATINMDGTAIYQGVCVVFIAACYGIHLTPTQLLMIVITATLASIGTAGVPGAGMVMLAMVLQSVGLPLAGIALVAGVDRIFDMGRTTVNITGDASCAVVVSNLLKNKLKSWNSDKSIVEEVEISECSEEA